MKIDKKNKEFKEFRKKEKRRNELYRSLLKAPRIPLKEPYQRGWEIFCDLRDDIKRRKDADIIREAMNLCVRTGYTRNPDLVREIRANKNAPITYWEGDTYFWDYKIKTYLTFITEKKYMELSDQLKACFYSYIISPKTRGAVAEVRYRIKYPNYFFISRTRPYMVTHVTQLNPEVISEIQEIDNWMNGSGFKQKAKAWSYNSWRKYDARERRLLEEGRKGDIQEEFRALFEENDNSFYNELYDRLYDIQNFI